MNTGIADPVERVLEGLEGVKACGEGKWEARCPAHDDAKPSLRVARADDGRALVHCHAGCATGDILKAMGLRARDLFPPQVKGQQTRRRLVATYPYRDRDGRLLFEVVRYEPKDFRQRRPDGNGGWVWNLSGTPRVLYRLPELLAADPAGWVFVVEGEKDVDHLRVVGVAATCNPGGAGKWGRLRNDSALHGRRVCIIPDRDEAGREHALDVGRRLKGKAREVRILDLQGDGVKDASDWLASLDGKEPAELRAALVAMADSAPTFDPAAVGDGERMPAPSIEKVGLTKALADAILAGGHFARDASGRLYHFAGGFYVPDGEREVKKAVKRLLDGWGMSEKWTIHRQGEVVEFIRVDPPELWEHPPLHTVNVLNGLLDVTTRQLRPHDPGFLSPVQLALVYDPGANCPAWDTFIAETFPSDAQHLPPQMVAWLMTPDTTIQKGVLLLGEGANGKSTFLAAVSAFLGKRNVCGLSLHKLESDRFAAARLVGKLANICPDLPSAHLAGSDVFKRITDGTEPVSAERKYAESFDLRCYARLVFSANHPPRSPDASHAFFRRWVVVPFNRTFAPAEQVPRNVLDARLADPRELSGVLNRALDALPGLRASGFTESESMRAAWDDFRETTDPVAVWLGANTERRPDAMCVKEDLLAAYNAAADRAGRPRVTSKGFTQALKRAFADLEDSQRTVRDKLRHVWLGVGLRAE